MGLYGLRDPRAARRLMDEAGAFIVGGRLLVREDDLVAHEDRLRHERKAGQTPAGTTRRAHPRRAAAGPAARRAEPLPPGWWREPYPESA